MSLSAAQKDALASWAALQRNAKSWRITLTGRTVSENTPFDIDALCSALDQASALAGSTVRTFVVLSLDKGGEEIGRTEVRCDPKELARVAQSERSAETQHIAATASALVATDHKTVAKAFEANSTALGESHSALIGMVKAFGEAGASMMKGNAAIVEALESRAQRDATMIVSLEDKLREASKRAERLESLLEKSMDEAERLKREQTDLIIMARAAFGPKVDELIKGMGASFGGLVNAGTDTPQ